MKRIKAGIRFLTLVIALVVAVGGLYNQVTLWQQQQVLGTKDVQDDQDSPVMEQALVARIIDGDTIELSDGRKVRYIGMDTPETKHPAKGVECFGQQAAQKNAELVVGKTVQLEKDVSETDRYGRLLRYVWLEGQMINSVLVSEGFAFARSYPPDIKHQAEFRVAEGQARDQQKGLWSSCPLQDPNQIQQFIEAVDEQVLGATDASEAAGLQPAF